jgi:hypothetical protein
LATTCEELFGTRHALLAVSNMATVGHQIYQRMSAPGRFIPADCQPLVADLVDQFARVAGVGDGQSVTWRGDRHRARWHRVRTTIDGLVCPMFNWDEHHLQLPDASAAAQGSGDLAKPRLISVRRVDVSNLVVAELDLQVSLFQGTHHLDQLRIEGAKPFAVTPTGLQRGRTWPPIWWWTRRQTLAEQQQWRATLVRVYGSWCVVSEWLKAEAPARRWDH